MPVVNNSDASPKPIVVDSGEEWWYFDRLPARARQLIADAPYDFSAKMAYSALLAARDYGEEYMFPDWLDAQFRASVKQNSITGVERNGNYKLVRRVHGRQRNRTNIFGA